MPYPYFFDALIHARKTWEYPDFNLCFSKYEQRITLKVGALPPIRSTARS
jgi:hypothetical protein